MDENGDEHGSLLRLKRLGMRVFEWTTERIAALKRLWADGSSAARIADLLSDPVKGEFTTRSAVLGQIHRRGLAARVQGPHDGGVRLPRKHAPAIIPRIVAPPTPIVAPTGPGILIAALTHESCRFPLGKWHERAKLFCGEPQADLAGGLPYCPYHAAKCFDFSSRRANRSVPQTRVPYRG
jgi:GcrA cell cycle regulator